MKFILRSFVLTKTNTMKKLFLSGLIVLTSAVSFGQTKDKNQKQEKEIFTVVEQSAEYTGGPEEMIKFIQRNLKYPESAQQAKVSGKCFVKFVVNDAGKIEQAEILKGVEGCKECDEEALRVVNMMPDWKPAAIKGNNVHCYFNLPIQFML